MGICKDLSVTRKMADGWFRVYTKQQIFYDVPCVQWLIPKSFPKIEKTVNRGHGSQRHLIERFQYTQCIMACYV